MECDAFHVMNFNTCKKMFNKKMNLKMYIIICCCRNLSYNKFTELPQLSELLNSSQFPTKLVILDMSGLNIGGPFPIWTSSRLMFLEQLWVPLPLKIHNVCAKPMIDEAVDQWPNYSWYISFGDFKTKTQQEKVDITK
jgi:hypothetical protein